MKETKTKRKIAQAGMRRVEEGEGGSGGGSVDARKSANEIGKLST